MKISRIVALVLLLVTLLSTAACQQHHESNLPDDDEQPINDTPEKNYVTYVYSITQKKLHLPDCAYAQNIGEDLRVEYSGDISLLFEKGFTICKSCLFVDNDDEDEKEETPREPDPDEVTPDLATYVVNKSSLKIHKKNCSYVDGINPENKKYTNLSYEALLTEEYVPCGHCMPIEYEEYKKTHPDTK